MALFDLMQHFRQEELSRKDWKNLACIATALSSQDDQVIEDQLLVLKKQNVPLPQVGALAFFSNAKRPARILSERFGVKVEDYRSTGGESGVDATPGYPLLAHLAFMGEMDLLDRALKWGANPNARWDVDRVMGTYCDERETISWVGECVRRGHHEFLERLLPLCDKPDEQEEYRRMVALNRCMTHCCKKPVVIPTIELFCPQGPYALSRSFWDMPTSPGQTLGFELTCGSVHYNSAWREHAHWPKVVEWLKQTAPSDGVQQTQAALAIIPVRGNFAQSTPKWCLDGMTDSQKQTVLEHSYAYAIEQTTNNTGVRATLTYLNDEFKRHLKPYEELARHLKTTDMQFPDAFQNIIAHLAPDKFRMLPVDAWEALANRWPKHLRPLAENAIFAHTLETVHFRDSAGLDKAQVQQANDTLRAIHTNALLAAKAPPSIAINKAPRL